jgi:hypothetical protein
MKGLKDKHIWVVPTQSLADRWFDSAFTPEVFLADPDSKYMNEQTVDQWVDSKKNADGKPAV